MFSIDKERNRCVLLNGKEAYTPLQAGTIYAKTRQFPDEVLVITPETEIQDLYTYHTIFQEKLTALYAENEQPDIQQEQVTEEEEKEFIEYVCSQDRLRYHDQYEQAEERLVQEFNFFRDKGYLSFLISLRNTIDQFQKDGIIWGVGRGSSCASYLLYVMGVHDIDPIAYDIPFHELSKEYD